MVKGKKEAKLDVRKSQRSIEISTQKKEVKRKNSHSESENIYKKLVEASLQGIVIAQGIPPRLVYANPAISNILGYSIDELTSLTWKQTQDLIHPDDQSIFFGRYKNRLEGKSVRPHYEVRAIGKDGNIVRVELSATQIEYNREPAVLATFVDITERKQAEEAVQKSGEETKRLAKENEIIAEIGRIISSTLNIEEVYERFAEETHKLIPFDGIAVNIIDHKAGTVTVPYVSGTVVPGCQPGDVIPLEGSVTGEVMQKHSGLIVPMADRTGLQTYFPTLLPAFDTGLRSVMAVPLSSKGQVIGAIHFRSTKPNAYSYQSLKLGDNIASQISGAIANALLFSERNQAEEEMHRKAVELAALNTTLLDIISPHDLSSLLQAIVERAARLLKAKGGGLYLCDSEKKEVLCVVSFNTPKDYKGTVFKYGEGAAGTVAKTGQPLIIDDYRTWSGRATIYEREKPFSAVLSVPMIWQGEVTGVIHVLNDIEFRRFTQADLELLSLFANHAAIAVENSRLYDSVRKELAEHKQTEEALRRSEEVYRNLVENARDVIFTLSTTGTITSLNPAFEEITGWPPAEWISKSFAPLLHPDDLPIATELFQRALRGEMVPMFELRVLFKSGEYGFGEFTATSQIEKGRVKGILGIARDINERKRAEEALRKREEEFRLTFENSKDAIFWADPETGLITNCNKEAETLLEKRREEIIGEHQTTLHPPQKAEYYTHLFKKHLEQERVADEEAEVITKLGKIKPVHITASVTLVGGKPIIQGIFRDITERKRAEEELRRKDAILDAVVFASEQFLRTIDWKQNIQEVLGRLGKATEASRSYIFENHTDQEGDLLTSQRYEWAAPGIVPQIDNLELQGFSLKKNGFERWVKILSKGQFIQGNIKDFPESEREVLAAQDIQSILIVPIFIGGEWWGFIGFDECHTERRWATGEIEALRSATETLGAAIQQKKAEETLRQSEERYRTILENIEDGYYEVDLHGNFTFFNDSLCRMLGYSREELIGMGNQQYTDEENRKKLFEAFNKVYRTGQPTKEFSWQIIRKDGIKRYGEVSISLIKDTEGKPVGFRGIARDTTDRKLAEEEIKQTISLLNATLESTADGILVVDREGKIEGFNQKFIQMWHIPESIIASRDDDQALAFVLSQLKDPKGFLNKVRELYGQPEADSYDLIEFKDGRIFERYSLPQWIGDQHVGRVWSFRDVTERKQAEEKLQMSEANYRAIFDSANDAIFIHDIETGDILDVNKKMCEMYGYTVEEARRTNVEVLSSGMPPYTQRDALQWIKKAVEGYPQLFEWMAKDKTGKLFWVEVNLKRVTIGGKDRLLAIVRDITERKKTEETITQSEERYRTLVEESFDGIFIQKGSDIIFANRRLHEMLGYEQGELEGCDHWIVYHSDYQALTRERALARLRGESPPNTYEVKFLRKDGMSFWGEIHAKVIKYSGEPGIQVWARDITERKRAEETLHNERERFRSLSESAPLGMVMIDQDGTFKYINPKFKELFGYDLNDVPDGRTWFRKAYPDSDYRHQVISTWLNDLVSSRSGETRSRVFTAKCKDGSEKIVNFIPVQLDSGENLLACEDITELKRAEEALKRSEEEAKQLAQENAVMVEIGRIISSSININEVYEQFSREVRKIIPFDRTIINIANPEADTFITAYVAGTDVDGRSSGAVIGWDGSLTKEVFHLQSSLLVQTEDVDELAGRYTALLPHFKCGLRSFMAVPLISKGNVIGVFQLQSNTPNLYKERDLRLTERVGNQISGAIANAQLFKELIQAEEEKVAIQDQLRQSQKMEAIGGLAGGIAHDFNNLLTVIKGYSELSLLGLNDGDPLEENINEICKASERAANLTRQLLAFSRKQILDFKILNLNSLIQELDKMLHRILGEDIELIYKLDENAGSVKTDPGQIEQVILNLVVNARDVMPSGGKLTIETLNVELNEDYARTHTEVTPGQYVMFSVSDNGKGMPPEIRERIFEPFFTTKEKGKGTGLGLSTVYGIVKQSGGHINVYSEQGIGTTFKIYLPRVDEEENNLQCNDLGASLLTGDETILLVEDEQSVRELATRILRERGYQIYPAPDGKEALKMFEDHPDRKIQLLLTDVVMPGISGREVADRLKLLTPDIKVLFISGYTDNAIVHHGVLDKGVNFVQKPFAPEALVRKVREVLDR